MSRGLLHDFMSPGLIHFMAYPAVALGEGPILETLSSVAADPFFHAVMVTHMKDPGVRREARAVMECAGLRIGYGAHPALLTAKLNLNALDEKERAKTVDVVRRGIDEACELGAESCCFLSGPWTPQTREECFDKLVKSLLELADHARTAGGMNLVLEVFDHDIDKKSLIGPAPLARRLAEAVVPQVPTFGFSVDISHIPLIGETPREAIVPVKDYIRAADVGNCVLSPADDPLYGDKHPRFGYAQGANGVKEIEEFLAVLLDVGFLNEEKPPVVSFEIKPTPAENPALVFAGGKRVLEKAWSGAYRRAGAKR